MPTPTTAAAPRKRATPAKPQDASAEMAKVMKKLHTLETQLGTLLERSLCDTLHATGEVAKDVGGIVRQMVGGAFETTRSVSQSLLQAGVRSAETGRATARDAAATVQDFGRLASEATRQVMRGTAEGLAEIRAARGRHPQR
ncbi:MAG: hypothetical protein AB1430_21680 [Pseudomonadota bacterium]